MTQRTFYLEQATRCAFAASTAGLANQREKFLAAEKAWRSLAELPTMFTALRSARLPDR